MDYAIGGIAVAALVVGCVEAAKEFGVKGKASRALALALGIVFTGIATAISADLLSASAVLWVELIVGSIAGGLSAIGYYNLGKRFFVLE